MIIRSEHEEALVSRLQSMPLILYGMGKVGQRIALWCDAHGISYVFADQQAQKQTDIPVIMPGEIPFRYPEANVVVASASYDEEIFDELRRLGISKERILSYKQFVKKNITWSNLDDGTDWRPMQLCVAMFSRWLDEKDTSVVDYGAGQMYLKEYLAADVLYYPIDYIRRDERTILCDLGKGDFSDIEADVGVCSGVLEYLENAEDFLAHVCGHARRKVILSYFGIEEIRDTERRRAMAFVSDMSGESIVSIMRTHGFSLVKKEEDPASHGGTVYLFERGRIGFLAGTD